MEEEGQLKVNDRSIANFTPASFEDRMKAQKELVEALRLQWKLLWSERFNDRVKAEDVSVGDYVPLQVERGTIIHATRDFKPLSFNDILRQNITENPERFVQPDAQVGGWNKFVRTKITKRSSGGRDGDFASSKKKTGQVQQPKKGGRGWLHTT